MLGSLLSCLAGRILEDLSEVFILEIILFLLVWEIEVTLEIFMAEQLRDD